MNKKQFYLGLYSYKDPSKNGYNLRFLPENSNVDPFVKDTSLISKKICILGKEYTIYNLKEFIDSFKNDASTEETVKLSSSDDFLQGLFYA